MSSLISSGLMFTSMRSSISGMTKRTQRKCDAARPDRTAKYGRGDALRFRWRAIRRRSRRSLDRGVLDARFFTGSFIEHIRAKSLALRPSEVHAQQNRSPVLGFRAAGAWLDSHDGVEVIVFAGKQRLRFELTEISIRGVNSRLRSFNNSSSSPRWFRPWPIDVRFHIIMRWRQASRPRRYWPPRACGRATPIALVPDCSRNSDWRCAVRELLLARDCARRQR